MRVVRISSQRLLNVARAQLDEGLLDVFEKRQRRLPFAVVLTNSWRPRELTSIDPNFQRQRPLQPHVPNPWERQTSGARAPRWLRLDLWASHAARAMLVPFEPIELREIPASQSRELASGT